MSYNKIAKRLNDEGVPTPAQYRREIGQLKTDRYDNARWNIFTLRSIVENPVYLGHTVQERQNVNNHLLKILGRFAAENKPTKFII